MLAQNAQAQISFDNYLLSKTKVSTGAVAEKRVLLDAQNFETTDEFIEAMDISSEAQVHLGKILASNFVCSIKDIAMLTDAQCTALIPQVGLLNTFLSTRRETINLATGSFP
jgi:hypothetical protein